MSLLLFIVFMTIAISATCSLLEAVLYSTRLGTLIAAQSRGSRRDLATRLVKMKKQISEPIAAILVMNTLANTAGATMAGMVAIQVMGAGWMTFFSILLTLGILFLAEIIPKTIGALYWKSLWPFIVWPLSTMQLVLRPAIFVIQKATSFLTGGRKTKTITEEEILALVNISASEGEISQRESFMVKNIIELENKTAHDIMTPRTVLFSMGEKVTLLEARKLVADQDFTRIPIYRDDRENIIGYVTTHDLNTGLHTPGKKDGIQEMIRPIHHVSEKANGLSLITEFLQSRRHISVVDDEFGGIAGIVTLEDLIETLLGVEIVDEKDSQIDMQKLARRKNKKNQSPTENKEKLVENPFDDSKGKQ